MNRNKTIIAVLQNAIAHLWNGSPEAFGSKLPHNKRPEYMCHAVEYAICEIVYGNRTSLEFACTTDDMFLELQAKIYAAIPDYSTACGYCRNVLGLYNCTEHQDFRKKTLASIMAVYEAKESEGQ